MRVDFYQLGETPAERVIALIAGKLLANRERLLVVASDEAALARLDRQLWDIEPTGFLPHGVSGAAEDARQPVLLSTSEDAPNAARNMLIADGQWRESALTYERAFFLFDHNVLEPARLAWKLLSGRDGVERNFWAQDDGKWVRKA